MLRIVLKCEDQEEAEAIGRGFCDTLVGSELFKNNQVMVNFTDEPKEVALMIETAKDVGSKRLLAREYVFDIG